MAPAGQSAKRLFLERGLITPYAGILIPVEDLALLISGFEKKLKEKDLEIEKLKKEKEIDKKLCDSSWKVKTDLLQKNLTLCEKQQSQQSEVFDQSLKACNSQKSWYRDPYLHFLLGNIVSSSICIGVNKVTK